MLPQLDTNQDGFVSREDYMRDHQRGATVGDIGTQRYTQRYHRFDSRFRAANRDRDGCLSPDEIDAMQGRRFCIIDAVSRESALADKHYAAVPPTVRFSTSSVG